MTVTIDNSYYLKYVRDNKNVDDGTIQLWKKESDQFGNVRNINTRYNYDMIIDMYVALIKENNSKRR